ncbi:MAG TPA: hypothetical protein VMW69_15270, partial [Spirochaetia bacterium]|nr:hypothetical protein [Spirochaetia bacterium]
MVTRVLASIGTALLFVLASCSDSGLVTPLTDQSSQIAIKSIASGTMVTSGDQIPLSVELNSSQSTPTDLKVELLSPAGAVVQSADIKNADFSAPLPSVLLSNLASGPYTLRLTLEGSTGEVLAQKKVNIFYVQGTYSLDGITSYPPALPPGGSGLIVARVTAPDGANPYLRWSMGDKLIANGYLKDGFDKIQWNAPSSTGVYSITVEMFPFGPPIGSSFDFTSPYTMKVEVFVTSSAKSGRNELGPKSSYYALYHFQGNLKDSTGRTQGLDAAPIGNPVLSVNGSVFGYQLDGNTGFKVDSLLLPFKADGTMEPASVTMRVRLDKEQINRKFFATSTTDGSFKFEMTTNDQGALSVSINGTEEQNALELKTGDITSITVSLLPANGAVELLWFLNGRLSLIDSLAVNPTLSSPAGTSTIAGAGGFTGLIDEFGVYYRDAAGRSTTDPEVYRRSMSDEYGSNLVFAEGFDGVFLPSDMVFDGKVDQSQIIDGSLSLNPNQSVSLPNLPIGEDDLTVDVSLAGLSDTGSGSLTLSQKGKTLYSVALK